MSQAVTTPARVQRAIPEDMREGFDSIKNMTHDECVRLWATLTGRAIEILRQRAQIILHFDQEGWDVHELANGHAYYYQRIAYGQMLAELFIAVADPALLDRASRLSIPDQERVAKNETVPVLISLKDNGEPYFQEMQLAQLAPKLASVVFHGNKICDKREQLAYVRSKTSPLGHEPVECNLVADTRRNIGICKYGRVTLAFPWAQIEACYNAMKKARGA